MKKIILFLVIASFGLAGLVFFSKKDKEKFSKPAIVCTTSIISDTVKNIVGDCFDVVSIMGAGIDPHLYKASSGDIYRIHEASIIFYNGLHLEGKMGEIFESMHKQGKKIFAVSNGIPKELLLSAGFENIYDPHIWHDVVLWKYVVAYITKIIVDEFPQYKDNIENNSRRYLIDLEWLHNFIIESIKKINYAKILITSHDAFSYFAKRYGIQFYSVQGISTDSEPSIADNEKILKIIIENGVKTIFVEQTVAENYLKNVQSILSLQNISIQLAKNKLYSDALGELHGNTYIAMMKDNIEAMVNGMNNYE